MYATVKVIERNRAGEGVRGYGVVWGNPCLTDSGSGNFKVLHEIWYISYNASDVR